MASVISAILVICSLLAVQRLRPHVSDREVHQVAAVLLDFRNSPMGELEMARLIIERLDDTRFGPR